MHIIGRTEQRRQRQYEYQDRSRSEALQRRSRHDPDAGPEHDAGGRNHAK
jgi:hypothetical protein